MKISQGDVDKAVRMRHNSNTRAAYKSALREFIGIDTSEIQGVISSWTDLSKSTINVRKSSLTLLLKVIGRSDILESLAFPDGRPPESRSAVSDGEIREMLAISNTAERLLLMTLAETGLRAGDLSKITWEDLQSESFRLSSKRSIPITVYTTNVLRTEAARCKEQLRTNVPFPWSYSTTWRMIKDLGEKIGANIYPHMFRHGYITRVVNQFSDLSIASSLVGHSNPNTTMRYRHLTKSQMATAAEAISIQ